MFVGKQASLSPVGSPSPPKTDTLFLFVLQTPEYLTRGKNLIEIGTFLGEWSPVQQKQSV